MHANLLTSLSEAQRLELIAALTDEEALALLYDWTFWAREKQLPPDWSWRTWLILTGRGFGKTRTGAEWVLWRVRHGYGRIALVAETKADARDVMVEGESGIIACAPPWDKPIYEPSKRRVTWNNGAIATTYSGDEPGQLRGPQHDSAWTDELAKYQYPDETLSNLQFGLRLGNNPQAVVTTTPRPIKVIKELLADATTAITRGSLYENIGNLPPTFIDLIRGKYEGTRLGRQEIAGEVLDDNPDALWKRDDIEKGRVRQHPPLARVVVAVDPSGSASGAEAGIVTSGATAGPPDKRELYVLNDSSGFMSADEWAAQAVTDYWKFEADAIVAEANYGGDMVRAVIKGKDARVNVVIVHASRGKQVRAEPVAAYYEQGRGRHVGTFPALEDELCEWDPLAGMPSPGRLDALVWGATDLLLRPLKDDEKSKPKVKRSIGL